MKIEIDNPVYRDIEEFYRLTASTNKYDPKNKPKPFIDRSRFPGWKLRFIQKQTHNFKGEIHQ